MAIDRRAFLQSLAGIAVIAAVPLRSTDPTELAPKAPQAIDLGAILNVRAPEGLTYNWVRSALLGEPDPENVQKRLDAGWSFVLPETHPELPTMSAERAIENFGLILMQKRTELINWPVPFRAEPSPQPLGAHERLTATIDAQNYIHAKKVVTAVRDGTHKPPYNYQELLDFIKDYESRSNDA